MNKWKKVVEKVSKGFKLDNVSLICKESLYPQFEIGKCYDYIDLYNFLLEKNKSFIINVNVNKFLNLELYEKSNKNVIVLKFNLDEIDLLNYIAFSLQGANGR